MHMQPILASRRKSVNDVLFMNEFEIRDSCRRAGPLEKTKVALPTLPLQWRLALSPRGSCDHNKS